MFLLQIKVDYIVYSTTIYILFIYHDARTSLSTACVELHEVGSCWWIGVHFLVQVILTVKNNNIIN